MSEAPVPLALEGRQALYRTGLIPRLKGEAPGFQTPIVNAWEMQGTDIQNSVIEAATVSVPPRNHGELGISLRSFADRMLIPLSQRRPARRVDIADAIALEETEREEAQVFTGIPHAERLRELNYARYLLGDLDLLLTADTYDATPLDELRLRGALLVGSIHHLVTDLSSNTKLNTTGRLELVQGMVPLVTTSYDFEVPPEPQPSPRERNLGTLPPPTIDIDAIRANRKRALTAWDVDLSPTDAALNAHVVWATQKKAA